MNTSPAFLMLSDGTFFEGKAFGKIGTTTGEICFNTGMTGYQEVFTDPSYFGQILIMNPAHIGNYGARTTDVESDSIKISGLICKNLSEKYSRNLGDQSLEEFLIQHNLVAIHEIDTRALVAHVRQQGAMNCIISSEIQDPNELKSRLDQVPSMEGLELATQVSTQTVYETGMEGGKRIAVLDLGVKQHILRSMTERGGHLKVFPARTSFATIQEFNPQAYFISNGPGDPASMPYAVETVQSILNNGKPVFGICMGHQIIALANGAKTYKMHHGHRGLNHPVLNLQTGRSEITIQNHGFAVDKQSVEQHPDLELTHINLNDQSLEGMRMKSKPVFSVQYHPEATPGPHDSRYLFDDFMDSIA